MKHFENTYSFPIAMNKDWLKLIIGNENVGTVFIQIEAGLE